MLRAQPKTVTINFISDKETLPVSPATFKRGGQEVRKKKEEKKTQKKKQKKKEREEGR